MRMHTANAYYAAFAVVSRCSSPSQWASSSSSSSTCSTPPSSKPRKHTSKRPKAISTLEIGRGAFMKNEVLRDAKTRKVLRCPSQTVQFPPSLTVRRHHHRRRPGVEVEMLEIESRPSLLLQVESDDMDTSEGYTHTAGDGMPGLDSWLLSEESRMFDMFINVNECED